jgi:hypothetical protein
MAGMAGRRRRRYRSPERRRGWERGAARARLGRFDRPRPEPAGLAQPGGLGGPVGLLGQQARWAILALANGFKNKILNLKFKVHFLLEFKPNLQIQITLIKHYLIL